MLDNVSSAFISVSVIPLLKWVYEYTKQQKWEKNKYLMDVYDKFITKPNTAQIHVILDYNDGIPFTINDNKNLQIDDNIVINALYSHDKKSSFTDIEYQIRNSFDAYLDDLTELVILSKCNLIDGKNLKLLLNYYLTILSSYNNSNKSHEYTKQLHHYMKFYKYDLVLEFINPSSTFNPKIIKKFVNKIKSAKQPYSSHNNYTSSYQNISKDN